MAAMRAGFNYKYPQMGQALRQILLP